MAEYRCPACQRQHVVPSGCRWCGCPERDHWHASPGRHDYAAPADAEVLLRMRLRRECAQLTARNAEHDRVSLALFRRGRSPR